MTDDNEILATLFKQGPLQDWILEEIFGDKLMRFAQAYLMMARNLEYRPAAPALTPEQYADENRIYLEAVTYAIDFSHAEDANEIHVGASYYNTCKSFVFIIEAARLLARGSINDEFAACLLRLALDEIAAAQLLKRKRAL